MVLSLLALVLAQPTSINKPPDKPATSAFGAALTAQETVPVALSFPYGFLDPLVVVTTADGGTVTVDGGHAVLTTNGTGFTELRSRVAARYIPGQGMSARFTLTHTGCRAGQEMAVGAGDSVDGFAFGCCATCGVDGGASFGVLRRSSSADNWVPVERWNGAWGRVAPDITKGRPYQIAWQWLGYGQITYSIEDAATGGFVVAHAVRYAGTASETSIANPTLPLLAYQRNTASDAGSILRVPSMALVRQGEEPNLGVRRSFQASRAVATTEKQVMALRNNATINGKVNRSMVRIDAISLYANGAPDIIWRIRLTPTQSGSGYAQVSTYSLASYDTDGGTVPGSGFELLSGVQAGNTSQTLDVTAMDMRLAPGDVISITGKSGSATPDLRVAITWREEL